MGLDSDAGHAEAELPFRQLAESLPTPCWISDRHGGIVWVNRAWIDYTGKTLADLELEGLSALHDRASLARVAERWASTLAAGEPDEMTFPLRGRDGRLRPFLTRVVPLRDSAGRITRWFGVNTDVSGQSEAEARAIRSEANLRESEARLRLATEAAGVGVWEWRLATNEMVYSDRARAICGFSADEPLTYDDIIAVTHPDDLPRTSAQARRALDPAVRDRSPYDYRIVRPSGEVRWVTAYGEAVFERGPDGAETATRYVGTLTDVTEQRLAEAAVRDSERRLQLAMRAGRMAAWQADGEGRLSASPEMNALIGLPPGATPTVDDLAPRYLPGELERIRAAAAAARARGDRNFEIEFRFRRADGEARWFYARAEALVTADGRPNGVIGVVMDVTERKADEERLRFLAREVDHRANNLLSIVQGAVALSQAATMEELRQVITGRVHALARAHQLLSDARWAGADLRRLLAEELAPFSLGESGERIRMDGPAVELTPVAAQSLAMVLHELTTNAAKHGALSRAGGRVEVSWGVTGESRLRLAWTERGGPPVERPARQGFGTSVIGRALGGALGGQTRLDWRRDGLVCEVDLPLGSEASP